MHNARQFTPPSIVIADDADQSRLLCRTFGSLGRKTCAVDSIKEALAFCREREPTMIVIDLDMQAADAFEMARVLRREACGQQAVLVAISVTPGLLGQQQAETSGSFDYVVKKPVEDAVLHQLVRFTADCDA